MRKIRINELARELEVKPGVILDLLPELGVQEKKTHSSSVDEDVALVLRDKLQGTGNSSDSGSRTSNGHLSDHDHESDSDETDSYEESPASRAAERHEQADEQPIAAIPAVAEAGEGSAKSTRPPLLPPLRSPSKDAPSLPMGLPMGVPSSVSMGKEASVSKSVPASSEAAPAPTSVAPSPVPALPPAGSPSSGSPSPGFPSLGPPSSGTPSAVPGTVAESAPLAQPAATAQPAGPAMPAEPERSTVRFQPLRPPLTSGSTLQPPLAPTPGQPPVPAAPTAPINRSIPIPARPLPSQPRSSSPQAHSAPPLSGPRQPLPPSEHPRQSPAPSTERVMRPGPGMQPRMTPSQPASLASSGGAPMQVPPPRPYQPPTHVVAPGSGQPGSSQSGSSQSGSSQSGSSQSGSSQLGASQPTASQSAASQASGSQSGQNPSSPNQPAAVSASAVPGSPMPPPMPTARPMGPRPGPGLTPGAPIAPRPPGARPSLAGQPSARPTVPPRPDLVQRLTKQQPPLRTAPAAPGAPRPGTPSVRSSPAPGQPLYRGPIRPGQPFMRGPAGPGGPGGPMQPGGIRRPGMRPMHPTTPLRAEPATPPPTEQQRRHQAKPGLRQGVRKREDREEGIIRERVSKRHAIAEPPPIDREITVAEGVTVKELSEKLGVKGNLVIKKLVERKIFATINQTLDVKLAEELARDFGASTNQVSYEEESTQDIELAEEPVDLVRRAPVVTIMGHVDHGKTSLLDAIRETNVAGREAGGITQHIGAYHIEKNGRKIVFIDTPGHQAFTRMRARGAKVTDIVVLVVSADDGVMPQTLEAIDHARAAKVPILVAINKIDKPGAQADRVKQQLSDRGLLAEDWGGDTVMVPVSAKTGQNLDLLLEMILLVADLQDLKATPSRPAIGTVLEAKLDKGRGPVATMLVRNGTFRVGDFFICGALFSKVRAMFDDRGAPVKEAEPSMPVEVIGLESLPEVGDSFQVVSDTSKAKQIVIYREAKARDAAMAKGARVATLDSLAQKFKEGDLKDLNLIIKADVGGTAEVLSDTLQQLSNDKVRVRVLHAGVGAITETDVLLASASDAIIVGFNVRPERNAQSTADQQKVGIRLHSIIYELIDEVKLSMTGMLDPVFKETIEGHAEVRETFRISKVGTVAGCFVTDGTIRRSSQLRVIRGGETIQTAKIEALKRFKNDASEVKNGLECGISLVNFNNVNVGDIFESFTMERVAAEAPVQ